MKILELTRLFYPSIGGIQKFVDNRLKIYKSLGFDYQVVTTIPAVSNNNELGKIKEVKYLKYYTPYFITPKLKEVMEFDYDILSVNEIGYFYSDYAIRKAFKKKKKIILTPHFFFHTRKYKTIKNYYSKYILPSTLKKVDKLICFTETEKKFWDINYSFIKKKTEIIPHYFEIQKIHEHKDKKYFLYLGRYGKNKRIDLLLEAFSQLDTEYSLFLTIENNDINSQLNNKLKSKKNIKFLGKVTEEHKNNLIRNCSALVFPTDYEAFGIVNMEVSNYKKPLLLSSLDVFKDILSPEGVIYFNNNVNSIKESIMKFTNLSQKKRSKMGEVNFKNLNRYSFSKIKSQYFSLFSDL